MPDLIRRSGGRKDPKVAEHEPVTSPDQHKPGVPKAARVGAAISALLLLTCLVGNHKGRIEDIFLISAAGLLVLGLVGDWVLRRNGLR